jgi:diketogulonate reductase-like aldo/keto reductase
MLFIGLRRRRYLYLLVCSQQSIFLLFFRQRRLQIADRVLVSNTPARAAASRYLFRRVAMKKTLTIPSLVLRGDIKIPQVGLGVWKAGRGKSSLDAVAAALRLGYRHVDTAQAYGNEHEVGEAIRASGLKREEVFVTTKLWNDDQGYDPARRAFDASLVRLGFDYVDLYLLHWPVAGKRLDSWRALEKLHAEGRARAIGVSNFLVPHLEELLAHASLPPSVNQIEVHPFHQQRETRAFCEAQGIAVEAYSPLTHGTLIDHPVVTSVAQTVKKSNAQVLLRWGIQHGMIVLPKSVSAARIEENAEVFDFALDLREMRRLDDLEQGHATGWDPREQA